MSAPFDTYPVRRKLHCWRSCFCLVSPKFTPPSLLTQGYKCDDYMSDAGFVLAFFGIFRNTHVRRTERQVCGPLLGIIVGQIYDMRQNGWESPYFLRYSLDIWPDSLSLAICYPRLANLCGLLMSVSEGGIGRGVFVLVEMLQIPYWITITWPIQYRHKQDRRIRNWFALHNWYSWQQAWDTKFGRKTQIHQYALW